MPAILSLVAVWNTVAHKGQGLSSSGALGSALRLRDVASTSGRRKDIEDLWQWQNVCNLWNCGVASALQVYRHSSCREGSVGWSCCKASRWWTNQRATSAHTASQLKTWAFTIKADSESLPGSDSNELAQERRAWWYLLPWRGRFNWWCRLNPPWVNADTSTSK